MFSNNLPTATYYVGFFTLNINVLAASWFKGDVMAIISNSIATGANPSIEDGFTINGEPGDLYDCSNGIKAI